MGTWQLGGKDLNIAEPREHARRDASVHMRAPLSSTSQENENNKKLYSALATQGNLFALMGTEMLEERVTTTPPPKPNS